jgi:hypothetical protein
VKLTFILPANAEGPTKVEVVSGHQMLKDAALDNVKTWKFKNPYAVERKYETTFQYRLSDVEVSTHAAGAVVTFDSFHRVDIVTTTPVWQPTENH